MTEFFEYALLGMLSGGVMALIAVSFVLIYKGSGVINFAVGEFMLLGAYLYYAGAVTFGLQPWQAFIAALAAISLVAVVLERLVLRPLAGQAAVSGADGHHRPGQHLSRGHRGHLGRRHLQPAGPAAAHTGQHG